MPAYYSWSKLAAVVILGSGFLSCRGLVLPPDFPRERQAKQRWEETRSEGNACKSWRLGGFLHPPPRLTKEGRLWLPSLWALTFTACEVMTLEVTWQRLHSLRKTVFLLFLQQSAVGFTSEWVQSSTVFSICDGSIHNLLFCAALSSDLSVRILSSRLSVLIDENSK